MSCRLFLPFSVWIEERGVVPGPGVGERLLDEKPSSTSEVSLLDVAGALDLSQESLMLEGDRRCEGSEETELANTVYARGLLRGIRNRSTYEACYEAYATGP